MKNREKNLKQSELQGDLELAKAVKEYAAKMKSGTANATEKAKYSAMLASVGISEVVAAPQQNQNSNARSQNNQNPANQNAGNASLRQNGSNSNNN